MTTAQIDENKVDPSVRALVTSAANDVSTLVSAQVELAKAELKQSASQAAAAFALIAVAAVFLFLMFVFLLITIAYGLVEVGLPVWAGFGIVTLALLLIGGVLILVGKKRAAKIKGPEQTVVEIDKLKEALSGVKSA
jgi:multidrug transporter EmrE-like cation transporter